MVSAISFWDQPIPLNLRIDAICCGLRAMLRNRSDVVSDYNILYNTKNYLYLHDKMFNLRVKRLGESPPEMSLDLKSRGAP